MARRVGRSRVSNAPASRARSVFPYPINDWKREDAYPLEKAFNNDPFNPPDDADPSWAGKRWAWEFLRRNADYQRLAAAYPDTVSQSEKMHRQGTPLEAVEVIEGRPLPLEVELFRRFGVPILIDPMRDDPQAHELAYFVHQPWVSPALPHSEEALAQIVKQARPETLLIEYDLSRQLAPQLKHTEAVFRTILTALSSVGIIKARHARKRFDRYPLYIRLLDAKYSGALNRDIAAVLYAPRKVAYAANKIYVGQSNLEKDYKAARKLVSGDYRHIPTL